MTDLVRKIQEIQAKALQQQDVRLPTGFREMLRAVPNGFVRSALFGLVQKGTDRNQFLQQVELASVKGVKVIYTGALLDQNDLNLWLACIHLAKEHKLGNVVAFSGKEMLELLGVSDTGPNRNAIDASLARLQATSLKIQQGRYRYAGSLLQESLQDTTTDAYAVAFNPSIKSLFANDQYTLLDSTIRQNLTSQLARWLYSFFATHKEPLPYKVESIKELCGSKTKDLWKFRQQLKEAMTEVETEYQKQQTPFSWKITENDLLQIKK